MSSTPNPQPSRPRPGTKTKAQYERSASPVPVPAQRVNAEHRRPHSESQRPRTAHGKKHPSPRTSASSRDTPRESLNRHDDLVSIGAWCDDIPKGHCTCRMSLDGDARAQLPRAPTPPSPPCVPRLDSPGPSILAYDTEFRVVETGEEDDRVGNAWYIARQAKTSRQCKSAIHPTPGSCPHTSIHPPARAAMGIEPLCRTC